MGRHGPLHSSSFVSSAGTMEVLRHLVSGDKYRLKEGNLDLDLTYISPTIIAMVKPFVLS